MNRILVIDSADVFFKYVELVVGRYGYSTRGAVSARDALDVLASEGADLIVAQEDLPDMQWSDFCRNAGSLADGSSVPIVVLTDDPSTFDAQGCEGVKVAAVRTRPISMRDLITVVQEHLPYRNKRQQIRAPLAISALMREGEEFVPCQVLNISEGGVFIMRKSPLPMGTRVQLVLPLKEQEAPLEVKGEVVYVEEKARGRHPRGMGVKFFEPDRETLEKLRRHLEHHVSLILGK